MRVWVLLFVVLFLGRSYSVCADDTSGVTNLMDQDPTADQLVDALKMPAPKMKYRSISVQQESPKPKALLRVTFGFNSAELTSGAKSTLDKVGQALGSPELQGNSFQIVGHTDGKGEAGYNLQLSSRRALAVKSYLEKSSGIDSSRLLPVGKGEGELLDKSDPYSRDNRRVEIVNVGME